MSLYLPRRTRFGRGRRAPATSGTTAVPVDPGLAIINERATGFFDFTNLADPSVQEIENLVSPGEFASIGSTTGVDTNDPIVIPSLSFPYAFLPGVDNSSVVVPFTYPNNATITIEFEAYLIPNGGVQGICNQYSTDGNNGAWAIRVTSGGRMVAFWSTDGGSLNSRFSDAGTVPFNEWFTGRVVYSHDGVGTISIDMFVNNVSILSTSTASAPIYNTAAPLQVGSRYSNSLDGSISRETMLGYLSYVDIDSQRIFDGTNGTVYRNNSYKTMLVSVGKGFIQTNGIDNFLSLPVSCTPDVTDTTNSYIALVSAKALDSLPVKAIFGTDPSLNTGLILIWQGDTIVARMGGSSGFVQSFTTSSLSPDTEHVTGLHVDNGSIRSYADTVGFSSSGSTAGVGTVTHASAIVGGSNFSVGYIPANINSVAIFKNEVPTDEELELVVTYMKSLTQ